MFYHAGILGKTGPLGTVWLVGHSSKKVSKKKILSTKILVVCSDLETYIGKFALPTRGSLLLGATIILQRQTAYLLQDAQELRKKMTVARSAKALVINMKEKSKEKMTATLTMKTTDAFNVVSDQWNFDEVYREVFGDETEDELFAAFRNNMARPEDITLPGAFVLVDPLMQKFLDDQQTGPAFDEFGGAFVDPFEGMDLDALRNNAEQALPDQSADQGPEGSALNVSAGVNSHVLPAPVVAREEAAVQEAGPGPEVVGAQEQQQMEVDIEGPSQVQPAQIPPPRNAARRRRGRRGPIIDLETQLSKEQMKLQIADKFIGTKPREDPRRVIAKAQYAQKEKLVYTTGDTSYGKFLQDTKHTAYKEAVKVFKDLDRLSMEEEDPFGWCPPDAPAQPPVETSRVDVQLDARQSVVPGVEREVVKSPEKTARSAERRVTGQGAMNELAVPALDFGADEPSFQQANVTVGSEQPRPGARVDEEVDPQEPAAKRPRRDLRPEEKVDKLLEAADFFESRFEKFKQTEAVEEVSFEKIMDGNSRKKVARCFSFMLSLVKDGRIKVRQEEPYAPIMIQKIDPDMSLADPAILSRPGYQ